MDQRIYKSKNNSFSSLIKKHNTFYNLLYFRKKLTSTKILIIRR